MGVKVSVQVVTTGVFFQRDYLTVYCEDSNIRNKATELLDKSFKDLCYKGDWENVYFDDSPKKLNPNMLRVKLKKNHIITPTHVQTCFSYHPKMSFKKIIANDVIFECNF